MCLKKKCFQELCSLCLLEHKQHIDSVFPLDEILEDNLKYFGNWNLQEMRQKLKEEQREQLEQLDQIKEDLY